MNKITGAVLTLIAALSICVGAGAEEAEQLAVPGMEIGAEKVQEIREKLNETAEKRAPRVTTLSNGVQIQRTPNLPDTDGTTIGGMADSIAYNTKYLDADRRGCNACHTDLVQLIEDMDFPHLHLKTGMEQDVNVEQCIVCHDYAGATAETMNFGALMHALHGTSNKAFSALGGDCWSCHYATEDGQGLQLWDNVKHDVMRGITPLDQEQVEQQMTFSWDQDTVLPGEDLFMLNWYYDANGVYRYASALTGVQPDPTTDGIYDDWTIAFDGDVDNPFEMTISELIDTFGLQKDTMTIHCGVNYIGGPWVGNFEITGISLKDIMEYAGVHESATIIQEDGADDSTYYAPVSFAKEDGAYIVLEVGGRPLPYSEGYPAQLWIGGQPAWNCVKHATKLTFLAEDLDTFELVPTGAYTEDGVSYFKPNVGLRYVHEGQIIKAGEPFTFEGFATAWETPITALEFSFDRGETWMRYETPDANIKSWVYWRLTWEAPEAGAYSIMIRAVEEDGEVSALPLDYLINVQ